MSLSTFRIIIVGALVGLALGLAIGYVAGAICGGVAAIPSLGNAEIERRYSMQGTAIGGITGVAIGLISGVLYSAVATKGNGTLVGTMTGAVTVGFGAGLLMVLVGQPVEIIIFYAACGVILGGLLGALSGFFMDVIIGYVLGS